MVTIEEAAAINRSRPIKVVIGDLDENIGQTICDSLNDDSGKGLSIETAIALRSDELIELVQADDFDLALLVLNNMIFDPHEADIRERVESGMTLVSELRHKYGLPVIALYGHPNDGSLAKQLMENGAMFASLVPCEWKDIESAFHDCIQLAHI